MHDSGKREQFESGAVRDTAEGKSRPDLVSPYAEDRIGQWMAKGALKYDERNWEKGMGIGRCIASISRHLVAFKMGLQDEDHLAAIAVNTQFIMHYQAMIGMGKLPTSLDDMPDYEDIVEVQDEIPKSGDYNALEIDGPELGRNRLSDKVRIKLRSNSFAPNCTLVQKLNAVNSIGEYRGPDSTLPEHILVCIDETLYSFFDDEVFPVKDD